MLEIQADPDKICDEIMIGFVSGDLIMVVNDNAKDGFPARVFFMPVKGIKDGTIDRDYLMQCLGFEDYED